MDALSAFTDKFQHWAYVSVGLYVFVIVLLVYWRMQGIRDDRLKTRGTLCCAVATVAVAAYAFRTFF